MSKKILLDNELLEDVSETLKVLAHPIRLSIIKLLNQYDELSVSTIYQHLSIEQAIASHHLRILKSKKVVKSRRDGQHSLYSLSNKEYFSIVEIMIELKIA